MRAPTRGGARPVGLGLDSESGRGTDGGSKLEGHEANRITSDTNATHGRAGASMSPDVPAPVP